MRYILLTPLEPTLTTEEAIEALQEFALDLVKIGNQLFSSSNNIEHLINMAYQCDLHGEIIEVKSTTKV